ncbi:MFS transporter [Streptomyces hoynatensis]|uniref:MFS transporter n=1 Tax=Streptomyces hoynatensis TaxID=1141874 RepID=A0A3A9ZBE3_9ACTN|nr:MFS transporter [Streptomyces hoynatensis]RKN45620.1 MFS transporter [Streptomyces hoynatensis]
MPRGSTNAPRGARRSRTLPAPLGDLGPRAAAAVVVSMAVAAFCFVTTENLPIGLLSPIAEDLGASEAAVGLLVTGYGLTVAVVSVPAARLTLGLPRRVLLRRVLVAFLLATWLSALAPAYWLLLAARLVTSLCQAVFWAVVGPTVAGLFPEEVRGRVLALTFSGGSIGGVLGVPAATWLGQAANWRAAFLALSALTACVLFAAARSLPDTRPEESHAATGTHPDRVAYRAVVTANALLVAGVFTAYTYLAAFLDEVGGLAEGAVTPMLLLYGAAGVVGGLSAGAVCDRYPRQAFTVPSALVVAALCLLAALGTHRFALVLGVGLTGFACACVPIASQNRIMRVAPGSTDLASAGNSAAFNVGIASGALLGGALVDAGHVRGIALAGALLAAAALALALAEPLLPRRARPARG